jgi:hypothetical protein
MATTAASAFASNIFKHHVSFSLVYPKPAAPYDFVSAASSQSGDARWLLPRLLLAAHQVYKKTMYNSHLSILNLLHHT